MSEQEDLQLLLRSRFPILVVETAEERRFLAIAEKVANLDQLGLLRAEQVAGLRAWADGRTVPAD